MPIRVAVFSALNRDMEVARYKGSALANKIIESLDNGPKYTYLIGHDTNLANLGEIFDLNWKLPGRDRNENTPGGYLTFEKWAVNGQPEIRVFYSALSPEFQEFFVYRKLLTAEVLLPHNNTQQDRLKPRYRRT